MTDLKYQILQIAYEDTHRKVDIGNLINLQLSTALQTKYAINELIYIGCLVQPIGTEYLKLTDKGAVDFELEREARQLKATEDYKHEKNYKFNRYTTIASLAIALISAISAILIAIFT